MLQRRGFKNVKNASYAAKGLFGTRFQLKVNDDINNGVKANLTFQRASAP